MIYNMLIILGYLYLFDFIVFFMGRDIVAVSTNSE